MISKILFSTVTGDYSILEWTLSQTIREVCIANRIPFNSVAIFTKGLKDYESFVGLDTKIGEIENQNELLVLKSDSNTNYENVTCKNTIIHRNSNPTTEYTFPSDSSSQDNFHIEMSNEDCKQYVINQITSFFKTEKISARSKIVLGISGGGDSNVLIESLIESKIFTPEQLIPVMVRGIPGTDKGIDRARKLCEDYSLKLIEIGQTKINRLIGRTIDNNWIDSFKRVFTESDVEIIGTLAIRLALFYVADKHKTDLTVLGLNMEDLLAENIIRVMQGALPLPFPVRVIENKKILFPLYQIPKKIIDGCNPKYSFQNYTERVPNTVVGRDIALYIAQMLPTIIQGCEFDFIRGFQKLSLKNKKPFFYDNDLKLTLLEKINFVTKHKWQVFLNN